MITVKQVLKEKGNNIWTISPDTTVYDALVLMAEKDVGSLVVVDHGKIIGIFSERDYARRGILKGKTSKDTKVKELMTSEVITVNPETTLEECMTIMTRSHVRHLPVTNEGKILGIVSIGDAVNKIIKEQKNTIGQLENYITGNPL